MLALAPPTPQANAATITSIQKDRQPTVAEDIEKGIIVEDVDTCASSTGAAMGHKWMPMNISEEQTIIPRADYSNIQKKVGGR